MSFMSVGPGVRSDQVVYNCTAYIGMYTTSQSYSVQLTVGWCGTMSDHWNCGHLGDVLSADHALSHVSIDCH